MQMPDELMRSVVDFELPTAGQYGVLMCFLPTDDAARGRLEQLLEQIVQDEVSGCSAGATCRSTLSTPARWPPPAGR